jgi:hypothetical protein
MTTLIKVAESLGGELVVGRKHTAGQAFEIRLDPNVTMADLRSAMDLYLGPFCDVGSLISSLEGIERQRELITKRETEKGGELVRTSLHVLVPNPGFNIDNRKQQWQKESERSRTSREHTLANEETRREREQEVRDRFTRELRERVTEARRRADERERLRQERARRPPGVVSVGQLKQLELPVAAGLPEVGPTGQPLLVRVRDARGRFTSETPRDERGRILPTRIVRPEERVAVKVARAQTAEEERAVRRAVEAELRQRAQERAAAQAAKPRPLPTRMPTEAEYAAKHADWSAEKVAVNYKRLGNLAQYRQR